VFFLALKLIRKTIGLLVKLVLFPFRLAMRLVGMRSGGSASDEATAAATATTGAAAGTAERRDDQSTAPAPEVEVAPGTRQNYDRFRKALYAYAGLGALSFLLSTVVGGVGGTSLVSIVLSVALPAGLGYWARTGTKAAWGAGMVYAGISLVLSLVGSIAVSLIDLPAGAIGDVGGLLGLVALLGLVQAGVLAVALYFGATGRAVALEPVAPTEPAPETTAAAATGDDATGREPSGSESTGTETAATGTTAEPTATEAAAGTETAATGTADVSGSPASGGAAAAGEAATADPSSPTDTGLTDDEPSTVDTSSDDPRPAATGGDAEAGADTAAEPDTPEETGPAVAGLAEEVAATRDPVDIRELGDRVDEEPVPDDVVTALETCAEADDPDIRVAVCDACAELPGDAVESILGRLRIDTNDRVATAAMEAY
jgi:hypothetical protein